MNPNAASLVLAAACGAAAGALSVWVLTPAEPPPQTAVVAMDEVVAELRGLRRELLTRPGPEAAPAVARRPDPAAPSQETELIAVLADQVARLAASIQRMPGAPAMELVDRRNPADWATLRRLHDELQTDEGATKRRLALKTIDEVLARYGMPDEVSGSKGRIYCGYSRGEESVSFVFQGGRLMWFETSFAQ